MANRNVEKGSEVMEHNVFLQAIDDQGNLHTWQYNSIKEYLVNENHVHGNEFWKFHKGEINGKKLEWSDKYPNLMRDVGDFQTYCRCNVNRKEIDTEVSQDILDKFLLEESKEGQERNYIAVSKGDINLSNRYTNGGSGLCEYRPGHIAGHDCFSSKGVKIEWINEDADVCQGMVTRTQIFNRIKELIVLGRYFTGEEEIKPKIVFYEDSNQLEGQMNILDFIGG